MKTPVHLVLFLAILVGSGAAASAQSTKNKRKMMQNETPSAVEVATFGSGCFWCTEAVMEMIDGVISAVSGYEGGYVPNPSYREVCEGTTGHAECVEVTYDPTKVSYAELLEAFFRSHDPTTLNRQGNDVGPQYRSVIFYHNDTQKQLAEKAKAELNASGAYSRPIVTQIAKKGTFYTAEAYHQDYYVNNPSQGYCAYVIAPKLEKFKKAFSKIK